MKNLTKKELIAKVEQLEQRIESNRQERIKNSFCKYSFIELLETDIIDGINEGELNDEDDIRELIDGIIENECIYYHDCFQIALELNATSFTGFEYGDATDISTLAYFALSEYVYEEGINMSKFDDLIIERDEALEKEED